MASPKIDGIPEDLRPIGNNKNALSLGAIYGANAAGKSNLVHAIAFFREMLLSQITPNSGTGVIPFVLDKKKLNEGSYFQIIFLNESDVCRYGFECSEYEIKKEWMYVNDKLYFDRVNIDGVVNVRFDGIFKDKENEDFYKFLVKGTRPEHLFFCELRDRNVDVLKHLHMWIISNLVIISAEGPYPHSGWKFYPGDFLVAFMRNILKCADSGIKDMNLRFVTNKGIDLSPGVQKDLFNSLKKASPYSKLPIVIGAPNGERRRIFALENDDLCEMEYVFIHSDDDGLPNFTFHNESEGTQRLIDLLPSLTPVHGHTIIVDELDRRLHPNLSRLLIEVWRKMNRQGSQLIFTTHDDNLLSDDLLRRDEVWLVDKDETGHSSLTSLAEFKIPEGTNIERQYLRGRFGGVPYLRREELDEFLNEIQNEGANLK